MICYRKPELDEINKIAKVHTECFPDYFLTSFGVDLIEKYYEEFFCENDLFIIAENENGEVVGFVMGYMQGSAARKTFETKYRSALVKNLLVRCLKFDKLAISKCFEKVKSILKSKLKRQGKDSDIKMGDLLSICVLPQWRGCGVAGELVCRFEKLLAENGVCKYTLSVLKDNDRARSFYEKSGFKLFCEGASEIKYIKTISNNKKEENESYQGEEK